MTQTKLKPARVRTRQSAQSATEVGYCKPPKKSQFKPGQSGNPKGRPKGTRNQKTILQEALNEQIAYLEQGQRKSASRRELVILKLVEKALKGDARSFSVLLEKDAAFEDDSSKRVDEEKASKEDIDANDKALLAELFSNEDEEGKQ